MKKMKEFFKAKVTKASMVASGAMMALAGVASAAEGDAASNSEQVITAMTTGFTNVAADLTKIILVIVPVALGVVGLNVLIKRGMAWFKSMSKG